MSFTTTVLNTFGGEGTPTVNNQNLCMTSDKNLHCFSQGPTYYHYKSTDNGATWDAGTSMYSFYSGGNGNYTNLAVVPYNDGLLAVNWQILSTFSGGYLSPYALVYTIYDPDTNTWTNPASFGQDDWSGSYTFVPGAIPTGTVITYWSGQSSLNPRTPRIIVTSDNSVYCVFDYGDSNSNNWHIWYSKLDAESLTWSSKVKIVDMANWRGSEGNLYYVTADYENNVHVVYFNSTDSKLYHVYKNATANDASWSTATEIPPPSGFTMSSAQAAWLFPNQKSGDLYLMKYTTSTKYHLYSWSSTGGWTCLDQTGQAFGTAYRGGLTQAANGDFLFIVYERPGIYIGDWYFYVYKRALTDGNTWTKSSLIDIVTYDDWGLSYNAIFNFMPKTAYPRLSQIPATGIAFLHPTNGWPNGLAFSTTDFEFPTVNLQAHNKTNTIYYIR